MGDEYELCKFDICRFKMGNGRPDPIFPAIFPSLLNAFVPEGRQSFQQLVTLAKAKGEGTGQTLSKKIFDDLRNYNVAALREFEAGACFAAGTLVHTQDGLKPIEQIKVGDMVLSKHESGEGERAYKRVTKTFVHEDREVMLITVGGLQPDGRRHSKTFVVTPEHPIWVKGKGWKTADKLKMTVNGMYVEVVTDIEAKVVNESRMYKSLKPDHAWVAAMDKMSHMGAGTLYNVPEHRYPGEHTNYYDESVPFKFRMKEEHRYKTTVYNLEVEDFHTYYVTDDGIWVHNKNITFNNPVNGATLPADIANKPFITGAELYAYTKKNQIKGENGEFFIIRSKAPSQEARGLDPKSLEYAELQKWLRHEENAPNRMIAPDKSTFEYAVPYFDPLYTGPGSQYRYLAIEGRLNATTWVDQKLSLVKADDVKGVLDLIYRTALRLKANPQEKVIYQFNPSLAKDALGNPVKSDGLIAAEKVIKDIREGGQILAEDVLGNTKRNELILEIIQSGRIHLQDAPLSQFVPQAVQESGPGLATDRLSQQAIDALLPIARQVWLDAGASPTAFAGLTVNLRELPTGFAAWTQGNTITLDTTGAGWGWYIDASPLDHSEFALSDAANAWRVDALEANNPAENRLDLLTVNNRGSGLPFPISHFTSHSHFHTPSQPGSRLNLGGQTPTLYPSDCAHPDRKRWAYFGFALLLEKLGSAKLPQRETQA